jgi:microcystin-dependent protein
MTNPFVAEIRLFACNFAPQGWALCAGQIMPISQNTALFSLLGTTYGGDGKSNFALPNLQGMVPIQQGQGAGLSVRDLGETGGEPVVTLLVNEIPGHSHTMNATATPGTATASNAGQLAFASAGASKTSAGTVANFYSSNPNKATTTLSPLAIGVRGQGLPHNNMMPYLGLNYCIALQGIFPARP